MPAVFNEKTGLRVINVCLQGNVDKEHEVTFTFVSLNFRKFYLQGHFYVFIDLQYLFLVKINFLMYFASVISYIVNASLRIKLRIQ